MRDNIGVNGVVVPIVVDEQKNIIDGWYRKKFAKEFGYDCPEVEQIGMPAYFLEGVSRYGLFSDPEWPIKAIYIFCRRPMFGGQTESAPFGSIWIVWDKNHKGPAITEWII